MPTRGLIALAVTTVALVLLINFKTPDQLSGQDGASLAIVAPAPSSGATGTNGTGSTKAKTGATPTRGTAGATPGATATPGTAQATPAPATAGSGSTIEVTGPMVSTRFGPVQVQVDIANGKVVDVVALQLPSGGRSGRISQIAGPLLHQEALTAQSAKIDGVSGATYTSTAYAKSLQAALDQAAA